jgi:hypothetical protein
MPDDRAERLRQLAAHRGISVNKLIEEWTIMGITEFDAESRFRARAARGSAERGLAMLAELDRRDREHNSPAFGLHEPPQKPYGKK